MGGGPGGIHGGCVQRKRLPFPVVQLEKMSCLVLARPGQRL